MVYSEDYTWASEQSNLLSDFIDIVSMDKEEKLDKDNLSIIEA